MLSPPTRSSSRPLTDRARSRMISPSSRNRFCRASETFFGSTVLSSIRVRDDCRYVAEVAMRRIISFRLQPRRGSSLASQSNNSGCDGLAPCVPKSSGGSTNPRPNRCCQMRFTATRRVNGFDSSTIHFARSSRFGRETAVEVGSLAAEPDSTLSGFKTDSAVG